MSNNYFIFSYGTTNTQTTSQAQIQQTTSRMSPSTQYQNPNSPCISQVINFFTTIYFVNV